MRKAVMASHTETLRVKGDLDLAKRVERARDEGRRAMEALK